MLITIALSWGPALMAVIGAYLMFWPLKEHDNKSKRFWFGAFILLAAIGAFALQWDRRHSIAEEKRFKAESLGKNNYAFFHSRRGLKKNGQYLLYLTGVGASPAVRIGRYRLATDQTEISEKWSLPFDIPHTTAEVDPPISGGFWRIDFLARHTKWRQFLTLEEDDGILLQTIEVRRYGETRCLHCDTTEFEIIEME